MLTRGMTRKSTNPAESLYNTVPQVLRNHQAYDLPDTLKEGQRPIRGRKPSARTRAPSPATSSHASSEMGASDEPEEASGGSNSEGDGDTPATNVPRAQGKIPDALTAEMLLLQSIDNFCQGATVAQGPSWPNRKRPLEGDMAR